MITVAQAREALESLWRDGQELAQEHADWYILYEFIKQYEDWVKVKKVSALLKGKDE